MFSLLHKGRVENTADDVVLAPHDVGNLLNLINKWTDRMKGWSTMGGKAPAEQLKAVRNLVATSLHGSECGRQLTRLIVMRGIQTVLAETRIKIEGAVMREGDSCMQNSCWTIMDGKVVERPADACIGIFSDDFDVITAFQTRPAGSVAIHFLKVSAKQVVFHNPFVAQRINLRLKAHRFEKELGVNDLVLRRGQETLTAAQKVAMALLWSVRTTDYQPDGSGTKGLVDVSGATVSMEVVWIGWRAYCGVVKARAARNNGFAEVSFREMVRFLRDPKMEIGKLDGEASEVGEPARVQLAGALELDRNLELMCYSMLSRAMINFPFLKERRCIVDGVKGFFTKEFLARKKIAQWVVEAATFEFSPAPVEAPSVQCAVDFSRVLFPPRKDVCEEESMAKRPKCDEKVQPVRGQPLVLRHATLEGTFGVVGQDKGSSKKNNKTRPELSVPLHSNDQLVYVGSLSELGSNAQPSLHFVLPPRRDAAKRMLVVGVVDTCLSAQSLLTSTCKFSDVARLFVLLLRGANDLTMPLDVASDAMLLAAAKHDHGIGCTVCNEGFWKNAAAIEFTENHHKKLLVDFQPDVVIAFGQEAVQLYNSGDNVFSVIWPARGDNVVEMDLFWRSLYRGLSGAAAALGCMLEDEVMVYKCFTAIRNPLRVVRLDCALELCERKALTSTDGSAGLTSKVKKFKKVEGKVKKSHIKENELDVAGTRVVKATRVCVPFNNVGNYSFVKRMTSGAGPDAPLQLVALVQERLRASVHAVNAVRVVLMLVDGVRAVAAASGARVAVFDYEAYVALFRLFEATTDKKVAESAKKFAEQVQLPGSVGLFSVLLDFVREEVLQFVNNAGIASCYVTFFVVPVAMDLATRLDVVVRQQLLLLLQTLFLLLSKGIMRSADCAIWFAMSSAEDVERMRARVRNVVEEVDVDAWKSVADPSDAGNSEWREEVKLDAGTHLKKVVGVLQRLAAPILEEVFVAGEVLREIVAALLDKTGLSVGNGESPLDKWLHLLEMGTFGKKGARHGRGQQEVHSVGATLGALREGLARAVLERMTEWGGCRLAPVPDKIWPFHLTASHFENTPGFRMFLLGRSDSLPWYQPGDLKGVTLESVFGVKEANSIIYTGGQMFSYLITAHKKRTATALLKERGIGGVAISALFGSAAERESRREAAVDTVKERVEAGKASAAVLEGKARRVPVGAAVGLVGEWRLGQQIDLPAGESFDFEYKAAMACAAVEVEMRADAEKKIRALGEAEYERARKEAREAGATLEVAGQKGNEAANAVIANAPVDDGLVERIRVAQHEVRERVAEEAEQVRDARAKGTAAAAAEKESMFTVRLQSNKTLSEGGFKVENGEKVRDTENRSIETAVIFLKWLLLHALVVLDPGDRWLVSGIVAVLVKYELKPQVDGTVNVELQFAFRAVRLSGFKWNHYHFEPPEVPAEAQQAAVQKVESLLKEFTSPEFLTATAEQRAAKVAEVMGAADAQARLKAGMAHVMRPEQVLRDEARTKHQRRLALAFVRKIDKICKESGAGGDPIVVVGAGGSGTGRRGRAACKHQVILRTLAGFFTVIMLDEHCTSKKTTCCHQNAHAPRSKGRSRGCKNKDCQRPDGKPPWWDRDTGAAW